MADTQINFHTLLPTVSINFVHIQDINLLMYLCICFSLLFVHLVRPTAPALQHRLLSLNSIFKPLFSRRQCEHPSAETPATAGTKPGPRGASRPPLCCWLTMRPDWKALSIPKKIKKKGPLERKKSCPLQILQVQSRELISFFLQQTKRKQIPDRPHRFHTDIISRGADRRVVLPTPPIPRKTRKWGRIENGTEENNGEG